MTPQEQFIANQERFGCERLNATLTVAQCKYNKKSGRVFSCTGCTGLGEKVIMENIVKADAAKEVARDAKPKKTPRQPMKKPRIVRGPNVKTYPLSAVIEEPEQTPAEPLPVGMTVDITSILDEAWKAKRQAWLQALVDAPPLTRLAMAHGMLGAISSLGGRDQ